MLRALTRRLTAIVLLGVLAGCARPPVPAAPNDPFEATNRARFEANLALDRRLTALTGGDAARPPDAPNPGRRILRNVAANLSIPSTVLNDLLQLRPDRAVGNTLRFAINSTVGLAGLFDPAGAMGLHGRSSDFGETLHRWGMGEGAYVVLPILGPSTERDALGMVIDLALDPWRLALGPGPARGVTVLRWLGRFAERGDYADLIDANVIRTADPYAQARLLYLQTRRYHLGVQTEDDSFDPYDFLD